MRVIIAAADDVLTKFEAAVYRVGEGEARKQFSRALNHEGRKGFTQVRRALTKQTSIKYGDVLRQTRFKSSSRADLEIVMTGEGYHFPLKYFGAKQFKKGTRVKVWGKLITFAHAFIVPRYGGNVYRRLGKPRFPIKRMYGPAIPVELVRADSVATFDALSPHLIREAERLLSLMIR